MIQKKGKLEILLEDYRQGLSVKLWSIWANVDAFLLILFSMYSLGYLKQTQQTNQEQNIYFMSH